MRAPLEPGYSCPHIDEAIAEMEKARKIHDELRKWGSWWESRAEEIEKESSEKIEELEDDVKKLNALVDDLRDEIEYLKKERDEANERAREFSSA